MSQAACRAQIPEAPSQLDVLVEIVEGLQFSSRVWGPVACCSPWGLSVPEGPAAFYAILEGECVLQGESLPQPVHLQTGDLAWITDGTVHRLGDTAGGPTMFLDHATCTGSATRDLSLQFGGEGEPVVMICGCLEFRNGQSGPRSVLAPLPTLLLVRGADGRPLPWLNNLLSLLVSELAESLAGTAAIIDHLIRVALIQTIRTNLSGRDAACLGVLTDPDLSHAIALIHRHPELPWTVSRLAQESNMSRSTFAARFTEVLSRTPMQYLIQRRMSAACQLLREGRMGLKEIAASIGYESAAAFSHAFKRWAGVSPRGFKENADDEANRSLHFPRSACDRH